MPNQQCQSTEGNQNTDLNDSDLINKQGYEQ